MFHRRPRTPSNAHLNTNPTPSAATAAAQAFLANRASNANLSAAAAAAALRSHTPPPTSVADVQTRRSLQRQASNSSNGSGAGAIRGSAPGLRRQGSSGSMSERSFRDPSPTRALSPQTSADAPPVPALPKTIPAEQPKKKKAKAAQRVSALPVEPPSTLPKKSRYRAGSLDQIEQRSLQYPTAKSGGRGVSLDRGAEATPGLVAARRASGILAAQDQGPQRPDSRASVNFSYPISPPMSPTGHRRISSAQSFDRETDSSGAVDAHRANGINSREVTDSQAATLTMEDRPVKKKKKKAPAQSPSQASRLPDKIEAASTHDGVANDSESSVGPSAGAIPAPKKKKKRRPVSQPSEITSQPGSSTYSPGATTYQSDLESISELDDTTAEQVIPFKTRAAGLLVKQPSVVREDREGEAQEEAAAQTATYPSSPSPKGVKKPPQTRSAKSPTSNKHIRAASQPHQIQTVVPRPSDVERVRNNDRGERPQSLSPTRYAHFTTGPPVTSPDTTKHQPPPRSVSPAKSALKHSPSLRATSQVDQTPSAFSIDHSRRHSELSDSSMLSEDGPHAFGTPKKKQNRVSFDEGSVVIGESASGPDSPVSSQFMSPQYSEPSTKKWFGFGRRRNEPAGEDDEADNVLKPTPALPSFGSVRGRKDNDRDAVSANSSREKPTQSSLAHSSWATKESEHSSSDHAIGGIISQEIAKRQSDAPRDPNAPLPPEVTSVEGTGYNSDTDGSLYSNEEQTIERQTHQGDVEDEAAAYRALTADAHGGESQDEQSSAIGQNDLMVPSIELVQPTPTMDQVDFPNGILDGVQNPSVDRVEHAQEDGETVIGGHHPTEPTPATLGIAEPEPEAAAIRHSPGLPAVGEVAEAIKIQTAGEVADTTDDADSIYSDAAEDLSDAEGDGFGSIDAVVESPTVDTRPGMAVTTPPDSPTASGGMHPSSLVSARDALDGTQNLKSSIRDSGDFSQQVGGAVTVGDQSTQRQPAAMKDRPNAGSEQPKSNIKKKKKKVVPAQQDPTSKVSGIPNKSAEPPLPPWPEQKSRKQDDVPRKAKAKAKATGLQDSRYATQAAQPAAHIRKSMRPSPEPEVLETHMRRSMRDSSARASTNQTSANPSSVKKSPAPANTRPLKSSLQKSRPVSAPIADSAWSTATAKEARQTPSLPTKPPPSTKKDTKQPKKPSLRRTKSDESDSSASASSFRRSRPRASSGGGFAMRKTMRGAAEAGESRHRQVGSLDSSIHSPTRAGRFSLRSISPPASSPRQSMGSPSPGGAFGKGTMRGSQRGSTDSGAATLRSKPQDRTKSPSRFSGFGKPSKAKAKPKAKGAKPGRRFSSRFSDSSEDDDALPTFRSRFVDSSDEDEPGVKRFTPVRGIPRRIGEEEGESTDLPDSSEEERKKAKASMKVSAPPSKKAEGTTALAAGSLRVDTATTEPSKGTDSPSTKKDKPKRSFFGLGRRKATVKSPQPGQSPIAQRSEDAPKADTPTGTSHSPLAAQLPQDGEIATNGPQSPASPTSPSGSARPKLVKRNTPKPNAPDTWPLPSFGPSAAVSADRPSTSDGFFRRKKKDDRPNIGARRSTTEGLNAAKVDGDSESAAPEPAEVEPSIAEKAGGKKKKFRKLRRAFGLHD
ncbi:MAG: hypothetical protein M1833_002932 [Piccolia ochrophora]|nr:MAG: hypothetical protein M1833_002932 [Piccolia ochrophora]